jgi:hypothetical protein
VKENHPVSNGVLFAIFSCNDGFFLDLPCEVVIVGVGGYWLALIGFIGIKRGFETAGLICRIGVYYIYLEHSVVLELFYYCNSQKTLLKKSPQQQKISLS